ncbi:hypothetical protein AgCh_000908 [Apium graveolens]
MFVPAIKGQGTDEQQEKWLLLAQTMQIISCYTQTELGHGSNVQGLETTATFDSKTDEFVLHSPTVTSSKDHLPLPGITVGDVGTKFGNGAYNTMDNGVLSFNHVRIPRNQMLMRVLQVSKERKCTYSDVPRQLIYGTMVYVRQKIVKDASNALSRAVTIATRYSCVRRQFGSQNGGQETQTYVSFLEMDSLLNGYNGCMAMCHRLKVNDFSTLQEAHACTAGLRSLTTSAAADAIEECRKLCGGHGYLCSSGLPELFAVYIPACTYEGDSIVLLLQVARYLVKTVSQLGSGKSSER